MAYEYVKLNDEPIEIEYVADEHEEENDLKPSFWFNNKRNFLENFIRTHNNPWVGGEWPEYIHGYESDVYYKPLFTELVGGDQAVNVYEEREVQE